MSTIFFMIFCILDHGWYASLSRNIRIVSVKDFEELNKSLSSGQSGIRYLVDIFMYSVYFIKTLKNVSCEYNRWMVDTQLCKLRGTSDTLIGRSCATFHNMCNTRYGVCELHILARYGW